MQMNEIKQLIEGVVEPLGYELIEVEFANNGQDFVLRVFIDAPGGIQVEDCETVSNDLSVLFDVEEPLDVAYILEVSSPGIDRPLTKPEHFQRFAGEKAKVTTFKSIDGRRRFTGIIRAGEAEQLVLEVDNTVLEFNYDQIESARLKPEISFGNRGR